MSNRDDPYSASAIDGLKPGPQARSLSSFSKQDGCTERSKGWHTVDRQWSAVAVEEDGELDDSSAGDHFSNLQTTSCTSSIATGVGFIDFTHAPPLPSGRSSAHIKHIAVNMDKLYAAYSERHAAADRPGSLSSGVNREVRGRQHSATKPRSSAVALSTGFDQDQASVDSENSSIDNDSVYERRHIFSMSENRDYSIRRLVSLTDLEEEASDLDVTSESDPDTDEGGSTGTIELSLFRRRFRRLQEQRSAQRSAWTQVDNQRAVLFDIRQRRTQANSDLRMAIQKLLPQNPQLDQLFKEAQRSDLNLQAEEATLYELIDDYHEGELQVELEEHQFFTNQSIPRSPSVASLRGIEGVRSRLVHPLFERFENALMELRNQIEWQNYVKSKKQLLESMLPKDLTEDDSHFLRDYELYERKAQDDVNHWFATSTRLEQECRLKQVIPEASPFQQEGYWRNPTPPDEIFLEQPEPPEYSQKPGPKSLAHPLYPYLLSNPKHLLQDPIPRTAKESLRMAASLPSAVKQKDKFVEEAKKEFGIEHLLAISENESKEDYINRWLLQKLRLSPLEVEVLFGTFCTIFKGFDIDKWQHDVLSFW
ncbi:hypothetical protein BKA67DRAFT_656973 [Truncatella angustata]|uniref:Uncharacterized protein n=1 Tax=Truncatella angustata TaxID=152316 RepID=A0A9P8UN81_9PEZI|nr:uncharacterized protein BKA67DRAFT_656973 [Truncatella angustata]KAH6655009.1 hypothetical protein BKA67DRAFT_656973 [Truncatella angustata]KAH8204099.1 hypothetical protein TruAng_001781 [Truncatella angustata]